MMQSEQSTAVTHSSFQLTVEPVQRDRSYSASEDLTQSVRQMLLGLHFKNRVKKFYSSIMPFIFHYQYAIIFKEVRDKN